MGAKPKPPHLEPHASPLWRPHTPTATNRKAPPPLADAPPSPQPQTPISETAGPSEDGARRPAKLPRYLTPTQAREKVHQDKVKALERQLKNLRMQRDSSAEEAAAARKELAESKTKMQGAEQERAAEALRQLKSPVGDARRLLEKQRKLDKLQEDFDNVCMEVKELRTAARSAERGTGGASSVAASPAEQPTASAGPALLRIRDPDTGSFSDALKLQALEHLVNGVSPSSVNAVLQSSAAFLEVDLEGGLPSKRYIRRQ